MTYFLFSYCIITLVVRRNQESSKCATILTANLKGRSLPITFKAYGICLFCPPILQA